MRASGPWFRACAPVLSAEALWVCVGSLAGSLPDGSQRPRPATLFFTGLPRHSHAHATPIGRPRLPEPRPRPLPPCLQLLARISRNSEPQTFPAGYTLGNSQVSPLQTRLQCLHLPLPGPFSTEASSVAWAPTLCKLKLEAHSPEALWGYSEE